MLIYIADCALRRRCGWDPKTKIKDNVKFFQSSRRRGKRPAHERALEMEKNSNGLMGYTKLSLSGSEMLLGVVDKAHIGAASFGLVHSVYEVYGGFESFFPGLTTVYVLRASGATRAPSRTSS